MCQTHDVCIVTKVAGKAVCLTRRCVASCAAAAAPATAAAVAAAAARAFRSHGSNVTCLYGLASFLCPVNTFNTRVIAGI